MIKLIQFIYSGSVFFKACEYPTVSNNKGFADFAEKFPNVAHISETKGSNFRLRRNYVIIIMVVIYRRRRNFQSSNQKDHFNNYYTTSRGLYFSTPFITPPTIRNWWVSYYVDSDSRRSRFQRSIIFIMPSRPFELCSALCEILKTVRIRSTFFYHYLPKFWFWGGIS